jgi:hypothetical protein
LSDYGLSHVSYVTLQQIVWDHHAVAYGCWMVWCGQNVERYESYMYVEFG